MLSESNYAEKVAPVIGKAKGTILDIGAGSGALTRHCLAGPSTWIAVEPNVEMRSVLASLQPSLEKKLIQLEVIPARWQDLPCDISASTAFAFNIGATHHEARSLFNTLQGRGLKAMVWVVPAQEAPSSFCLAGYLPPEIHQEDTTPAYLKTMAQLGPSDRPHSIAFVDWMCRYTFTSNEALLSHFKERLGLKDGTDKARDLECYLRKKIKSSKVGMQISCEKRSAVMRWEFNN
jgi:hypothetical protein